MINIAICDDEIVITHQIKEMLQNHNFDETVAIDTFSDGEKLYQNAINKRYDILMMDIELTKVKSSNKNGMEISRKIKAMYPDILIIFFTGYMSYKSALLNFEPFRFLEKPVIKDEVISAVNDAVERINGWKNNFFQTKIGGNIIRIKFKKIILFESSRPYIFINAVDKSDCVKFRGKMDDVEKEVNKVSNDFLRINKSALINKEYIERCSTKEAVMMTGDIVSVGRKYVNNVSKMLLEM